MAKHINFILNSISFSDKRGVLYCFSFSFRFSSISIVFILLYKNVMQFEKEATFLPMSCCSMHFVSAN